MPFLSMENRLSSQQQKLRRLLPREMNDESSSCQEEAYISLIAGHIQVYTAETVNPAATDYRRTEHSPLKIRQS
jgi:hypothetical protein